MLFNFITGITLNGADQYIEIIALEEGHFAALATQQQMLMSRSGRDKRLATLWLVNPLNQPEFFQFFQSAVDADQSQFPIFPACPIKNLHRRQCLSGFLNNVYYNTACFR